MNTYVRTYVQRNERKQHTQQYVHQKVLSSQEILSYASVKPKSVLRCYHVNLLNFCQNLSLQKMLVDE